MPVINTVRELKEELNKYPDDMLLFVLCHGDKNDMSMSVKCHGDYAGSINQHNLQKVEEFEPWHGERKLLGLNIHRFNKELK